MGYDKIAAAHTKANAAWDAKAAADKAALDATREGTKKDFEKKAAAAQADYDAKMAHAATLKKIADEAAAAAAASVKKSEEDQKAADAAANAADARMPRTPSVPLKAPSAVPRKALAR